MLSYVPCFSAGASAHPLRYFLPTTSMCYSSFVVAMFDIFITTRCHRPLTFTLCSGSSYVGGEYNSHSSLVFIQLLMSIYISRHQYHSISFIHIPSVSWCPFILRAGSIAFLFYFVPINTFPGSSLDFRPALEYSI